MDYARAVEFLKSGRLVAFPTETVYGLGADATNAPAVERIYRTKGRPATNPLIVHVADEATARRCAVDWPQSASRLARVFWPGPLTIVLKKRQGGAEAGDGLLIPDIATAGLDTVALRVPSHPVALELLRAFGGAVAAPSANRSTRISPTTAQHVLDEFPYSQAANDGDGEPAMLLDGGAGEVGIESTVVDLTGERPRILWPGQITAADLAAILGAVDSAPVSRAADQPAESPGQHETHYAPTTPAFRFETSQRGLIQIETQDKAPNGLVALSPLVIFKKWGRIIALPNHPEQYARHVYAVLRELDEMNLHAIFIEMPPDIPTWAAIRDRLRRATRPFEQAPH